MRRYIYNITLSLALTFLICGAMVEIRAQSPFREFTVSVRTNPSPGYLFVGQNSSDSFAVIDHSGKNMFKVQTGMCANVSVYDGRWLSHFSAPVFLRRNTSMAVVDTMRVTPPYITDFHEGRVLSDSTYLVLGIDTVRTDMSKVVSGGDPNAIVWGNVIQVRTFSGATLFTWRSLEHIPVTDATDSTYLTGPTVDYLHVNSVYIDTDGNLIVSCRHTDEVIKVSRTTGEVMWRMGGSASKKNQFNFLNDEQNGYFGFSHQHSAIRTSRGTILIFDNGNKKPTPQRSRVVEYEVNEVARTARKVWEYTPDVFVYAPTMGSVQEMENGNILIGYGSGSSNIIAQEVTRVGQVVFELRNTSNSDYSPYRVHRDARFLMTGVQKSVSTPGLVQFQTVDSTTHVSLNLVRVDQQVSLSVERHSYPPHNLVMSDGGECGVLPMRWVIRNTNSAAVNGSMILALGNVPGIDDPSKARIYWRADEGMGTFDRLTITYDTVKKTATTSNVVSGEFLVTYPYCITPTLLMPNQAEVEVPLSPMLKWSQAAGTGRYHVEVSPSSQFAVDVVRFTTSRLDTTMGPLQRFTKYYWRVRSERSGGYGPWSNVGLFTTKLGVPSIITPTVDIDTAGVLRSHSFSWTAVPEAKFYRVEIKDVDGVTILDTTASSNEIAAARALSYNAWYSWKVRSAVDSINGEWSNPKMFVTALAPPTALSPTLNEILNVPADAELLWKSVPGALSYAATVSSYVTNAVDSVYSVADTTLSSILVEPAQRYRWSVRGSGRYGLGNVSDTLAFGVSGAVAANTPVLKSPVSEAGIDTMDVVFEWDSGDLPVILELDTLPVFQSPLTRTLVGTGDSHKLSGLKPGFVFYWRLAVQSESAISAWSDTATFTTVASDNLGLTPIIPRSGSVGVATQGIILFSPSTRFSRYEVLIDTTVSFSSPILSLRTESSITSYAGLREGLTYYYRVRGSDSLDSWTYGPVARFRTTGIVSVGSESTIEDPHCVVVRSEQGIQVTTKNGITIYSVKGYDLNGRCLAHLNVPPGVTSARLEQVSGSKPVFVLIDTSSGLVLVKVI